MVFDGIKMGGQIILNGHVLGNATNQFRRWVFPLAGPLGLELESNAINTLEVKFDDNIDTESRFMSCSGGWDWAPYR